MIRQIIETPWTVALGAAVGLFLAPVGQSAWDATRAYYDEMRPVVVMSIRLVDVSAGEVRVRIVGEKRRACDYLRMQAYTRGADGSLADAYARREDRKERGDTKPIGAYDIGVWSIWPASGAVAVLMAVQHDCGGRIVLTKIGEVPIPQKGPT